MNFVCFTNPEKNSKFCIELEYPLLNYCLAIMTANTTVLAQ